MTSEPDEPDDLARAIEAALFAAEGPMTLAEIATVLGQRDGLPRVWSASPPAMPGAASTSSSGAGAGTFRRRPISPTSCAASARSRAG